MATTPPRRWRRGRKASPGRSPRPCAGDSATCPSPTARTRRPRSATSAASCSAPTRPRPARTPTATRSSTSKIATADPQRTLAQVRWAAEILIGQTTPMAAANFTLGVPNTLPSGGFARVSSGITGAHVPGRLVDGADLGGGAGRDGAGRARARAARGLPGARRGARARALMRGVANLMVTCLVDLLRPEAGEPAVRTLRRCGYRVAFARARPAAASRPGTAASTTRRAASPRRPSRRWPPRAGPSSASRARAPRRCSTPGPSCSATTRPPMWPPARSSTGRSWRRWRATPRRRPNGGRWHGTAPATSGATWAIRPRARPCWPHSDAWSA